MFHEYPFTLSTSVRVRFIMVQSLHASVNRRMLERSKGMSMWVCIEQLSSWAVEHAIFIHSIFFVNIRKQLWTLRHQFGEVIWTCPFVQLLCSVSCLQHHRLAIWDLKHQEQEGWITSETLGKSCNRTCWLECDFYCKSPVYISLVINIWSMWQAHSLQIF